MNIIQLPLAAFLISILLMILFFSRENIKTEETSIYGKMLFINFLTSVLCIFGILFAAANVGDVFIGYLQKIYLAQDKSMKKSFNCLMQLFC